MKKFTKGKWQPVYDAKVCTGVGVTENINGGKYSTMIVFTLLPDNDAEYEKEKEEIEANARLIAAAPELLDIVDRVLALGALERDSFFELFHEARSVYKKAIGVNAKTTDQ